MSRKELEEAGKPVEMEALSRLLVYFGPLPDGLVKHTNDRKWEGLLTDLSKTVGDMDPDSHFGQWQEEDFPHLDAETKRMLSRMLSLNPAERSTIDEVLEDPWWSAKDTNSIERL